MPQLDFGAWFNQTSSVLLGFWLLVYIFFFVFLTQGTWLMKLRTKLTNFRSVVHNLLTQQSLVLAQEVNGVTFMMTTSTLAMASSTMTAVTPLAVTETQNEILNATTDLSVELESLNALDLTIFDNIEEDDTYLGDEDHPVILSLVGEVSEA